LKRQPPPWGDIPTAFFMAFFAAADGALGGTPTRGPSLDDGQTIFFTKPS